jgi:hypothetical protein
MAKVQAMHKGIFSVTDDPWATRGYPLTRRVWILAKFYTHRGYEFGIAKSNRFIPVAIPTQDTGDGDQEANRGRSVQHCPTRLAVHLMPPDRGSRT